MKLNVHVLGTHVAVLEQVGDFKSVMSYLPDVAPENLVSLTMPVRTESYPWDGGNFVIKSTAMVSKGMASGVGKMGCSDALVGRLLTLFLWQSAHPWTYCCTSFRSPGHQ